MKKTPFLAVLFLLVSVSLAAQINTSVSGGEQLAPLVMNPSQAAEFLQRISSRSIVTPTDTITVPTAGIRETFSYDSHRPDTSLWDVSLNPGVFINRGWAIAPPNLGVCTFDGLDYQGAPYDSMASVNSTEQCDVLTSRPIDLSTFSPADSMYLSFWYQAQGRGYAPNQQDSLILDFNIPAWNPNSTVIVWKTIWFSEGYTPASSDSSFRIAMMKLDSASYFVKGFRFRLRNYASGCGSNDHWHVDEVYLKSQRTYNDTVSLHVDFAYPASSALTNYWAVPHTHYKSTLMATNFNVQIRNNDTTSLGRSVDYSHMIYDETGALYYQTAVATIGCPYYQSAGYLNYAPISNPAIAFSYPQAPILSDTTTYYIKHRLKSSNDLDTMVQAQKFYNYYAYDDGSAEVGYGLISSNASLAYQFKMEGATADTLKAVQMYFVPVMNTNALRLRDWNLVVWSNDGPGGAPGTVLYRQRNQHIGFNYEAPDRFLTYTIDSGTVVLQPNQVYYVGWQQLGPDRLYIGFDFNDDHHDKIYYNTTGNWTSSIFSGSLMMRPVFADVYDASGVHEQTNTNGFALYPNPANDQVKIELADKSSDYSAVVIDLSGREIMQASVLSGNGSIDVSSLGAGMYFVQLRDSNGTVAGLQRLVIAH